jgi:hypothetical protein
MQTKHTDTSHLAVPPPTSAVAGLPEPRKDHAVVMARFSRDTLQKFNILVKQLVVELGPDTEDMRIRIGLHSGPVTAGVLRGERCRFQLFGDTVSIKGVPSYKLSPCFLCLTMLYRFRLFGFVLAFKKVNTSTCGVHTVDSSQLTPALSFFAHLFVFFNAQLLAWSRTDCPTTFIYPKRQRIACPWQASRIGSSPESIKS